MDRRAAFAALRWVQEEADERPIDSDEEQEDLQEELEEEMGNSHCLDVTAIYGKWAMRRSNWHKMKALIPQHLYDRGFVRNVWETIWPDLEILKEHWKRHKIELLLILSVQAATQHCIRS